MTFYTRMNNPRIHRFYRPPYRYAHTRTRAHTRIYIYFHFVRRSPIIIDSKFMPLNDLQTSIRMQRDIFETRASWLKKIQFVTIRVFFFLLLLFFFFFSFFAIYFSRFSRSSYWFLRYLTRCINRGPRYYVRQTNCNTCVKQDLSERYVELIGMISYKAVVNVRFTWTIRIRWWAAWREERLLTILREFVLCFLKLLKFVFPQILL